MAIDFFRIANAGVQQLKPYQAGKPIEELQREYGLKQVVKLASNENPLGTSPKALNALKNACTAENLARYPDSNGFRLKAQLAAKLKLSPQQITLGNGSNDVLELIARAFANEQHSTLFSQYAFAVYPIITQAIGARAIVVPAKDWGHDLSAMLAAIETDTQVIFIANPNNPTGTWLTQHALHNFLHQVPATILVVLDEAYVEYVSEPDYPNSLPWLADFPNLIITRTFSKAYGLAGLRVGYALSHPDIADLLNRVRQPFNVNSLALLAAENALDDGAHLQKAIELNQQGRAYLSQAIESMGFSVIPSVGNFICVDFQQDAQTLYQKLLQHGVIVRPVANYGLPQHLRISMGLPDENVFFINKLARCL